MLGEKARDARRRTRILVTIAMLAAAIAVTLAASSARAIAQEYTIDSAASEALTGYLRKNRLPLVGAQIGKAPGGARRLVLYGYVATQYGRSDAESKALGYLGSPRPEVVNRIVIQPEIAKMKGDSSGAAAAAAPGVAGEQQQGSFAGQSIDQVLDDIQRYGIHRVPDAPGLQ